VGADMRQALQEQLDFVTFARDNAWDGVFTGHHYLSEGFSQLQPVPFLARLAAESGELDLGIAVALIGLMNPVEFAEQIVALDIITDGRLIVGVGQGYRAVEFAAFGVRKDQRRQRYLSHYAIARRLLAGEQVSAELPECELRDAVLSTLPLQEGGPPFWMGASNDRAVIRAARLADGWVINPAAKTAVIADQIAGFRKESAARGVEAEIIPFREVFCAASREQALELVGPHLRRKYDVYDTWGQGETVGNGAAFGESAASLADSRFILGSPDECIEHLQWWKDVAGASYFLVRTEWAGLRIKDAMNSLRLLTSEVLPALRSAETVD
jgi:alkanesulfonate monooxygenase SsuD/methylene tetrahydromethanopterin reductase-like flavin-dependent oxidoreductase (luciferase family)